MDRVGVRELRRDASAILRRVAAGETVEVTDRGRPVAVLTPAMTTGLARLERDGRLRRGRGGLLSVKPVRPVPGSVLPSSLIEAGRDE